ncbi:hypothetical protein CTI12_AA487050 [Artemisia annua]|uniref:Uncharacterized protein n=1 Tax=Artemisia annua TaxID=35608 RepID=A0A2U1LIR2_ARTAN|nr:hypothetical protein CTI12_AA487050 [Artemisia annua]
MESENRDEDIALVIPPIFDQCTKILGPDDQMLARDLYQMLARDLYREVVYNEGSKEKGGGLKRVKEAEKGLPFLLEWGCSREWEGGLHGQGS